MTILTVEYRDLPEFPGYRVGSDGTIWSRRGQRWRTFRKNWRLLSPKKDARGRVRVQLYVADHQRPVTRFLHRLILIAFVGPCPDGMVCCHANDDAGDNRLDNLRWDTPKANSADALKNGRLRLGPSHHFARLTETQVRGLRLAARQGASASALAMVSGLSDTAVRNVIRGKAWACLCQSSDDPSA